MNDDSKLRAKLLLVLLAIVIAASLALFFTFSNVLLRILVVISALTIVGLVLRIALVFGVSDNRVRLVVLTSSLALLFGVLQVQHSFDWLYKPIVAELFRRLHFDLPVGVLEDDNSFDAISALIVVAWVAIVFLVMRRLGNSDAMGAPKAPLDDVLPGVTNLNRIQLLKRTLRDRLDHIDFSTRWNEANFVSLEAEVQILEGKSSKRKVVDLIRALRINPKTRLFVVLGEPGTGKSVALRKLTRDLLGESGIKDRIPIYLNLKEWKTPQDWSLENRPTTQQFHEFVYNTVLQSIDFTSQAFLSPENYSALLEAGYLFFILDSFDEIPAVLDHDENSWIISDLSEVISRYVLSGKQSRGIIASRLFRQPKMVVKERSVFEIQPFTDDRIIRAIRLACSNPRDLLRVVLTERNDLGTIARNPFLLHLIINHYNQKGAAPSSQAQMFESFIDFNLKQAKAAYGLDGFSEEEVYGVCERIAAAMFVETRAGLEIGEPELRNEVDLPQLPYVLRFLSQARLGRVAPVSGAFSFSHRRFNEYFLVRRLSGGRAKIPFDAIQSDSRWRDALVLYAEIAEPDAAHQLAQHAWSFVSYLGWDLSLLDRRRFVQGRHALRFLAEGFRNRSDIIESYRSDLELMAREKLSSGSDYIEKKTVLEGIALLSSDSASLLIVHSLNRYPGWISEEAAASARYLKRVSPLLARALYRHCVKRPAFNGVIEAWRQLRVLRISSAFEDVCSQLRWYLVDVAKSFVGVIMLFAIPFVAHESYWKTNEMIALVTMPTPYLLAFAMSRFSRGRSPARNSKFAQRLSWIGKQFRPGDLWNVISAPKVYAAFVISLLLVNYVEPFLPFAPEHWPALTAPRFDQVPTYVNLAIVVIGLLVVIPLQRSFWSYISPRRWRFSRSLIKAIVTFVSALVMFGLLVFTVPISAQRVFVFVSGSGIVFIVAFSLWFPIRDGVGDWLKLRRIKQRFAPDRAVIAAQLAMLKSPWGRLKYVRWIEEVSSDHVEAFGREGNIWPNDKRPQQDGDEATIRLAQIDMKWLKFY